MTKKRLSTIQTAGFRLFSDRLTRAVVSGGGFLVLLALLGLFCFLLYAALPLFRSANVGADLNRLPVAKGQVMALGADDANAWVWSIDHLGQGQFIGLHGQVPLTAQPLLAGADRVVAASGGQPLYALTTPEGGLRLAAPDFSAAVPVWRFPFAALVSAVGDRPLRQLALASVAPDRAQLALQTADGRVEVISSGAQGVRRWPLSPDVLPVDRLLWSADGRLLYRLAGHQLSIYELADNGAPQWREQRQLTDSDQGPLTLWVAPADGSLLVGQGDGRLTQWFDIATHNGHRLARIRQFDVHFRPGSQLAAPARRPVFGMLAADGSVTLFSLRDRAPLLILPRSASYPPPGLTAVSVSGSADVKAGLSAALPVDAQHGRQLAFSPQGNGLLLSEGNLLMRRPLDLASPDISWRTLIRPVWYPQYPAPAWLWQSTPADARQGGKYSVVPLVVGTVKAAGYAMLFATPLALAAAIYSAWFMSPGLRRWVKPAMEIMGAVPSVIIGVIAMLWLVPHIADALGAVVLLPLVVPLVVLACGALMGRSTLPLRRALPAGWECVLLLPLIALTVWLLFWLTPGVERWLFGRSLSAALGGHYNPLNALVVGIAMGFALIPLMYSLAEEALFNVPSTLIKGSLALGATPWQTLLGVTLPSASAGLFSAFILGIGRAVGETMIVLMASGNMPQVDGSLFQGLRALAANIAIEIPEAAQGGELYRVLFLTALVLFVFTFVINTAAEALRLRLKARYRQHDGEAA